MLKQPRSPRSCCIRFRIIIRRVAKSRVLAAFDPHNFRRHIRHRKFNLIRRERSVAGIDVNIHRSKANTRILSRRLGNQRPRQRAKQDGQPVFRKRSRPPMATACAAINATSRSSTTPSPLTSNRAGNDWPLFNSRAKAKESRMSTFPSRFKSSRANRAGAGVVTSRVIPTIMASPITNAGHSIHRRKYPEFVFARRLKCRRAASRTVRST